MQHAHCRRGRRERGACTDTDLDFLDARVEGRHVKFAVLVAAQQAQKQACRLEGIDGIEGNAPP